MPHFTPTRECRVIRHERAIFTIDPETTALRAVYYYPPRFARRGSMAVPRAPDVSRGLLCVAGRPAAQPARHVLRGRRCPTASMQRRARRPRRCASRPIPDADARLRAMSCRVLVLEDSDSHASRQALRLFPRATVIGNAAGCHTRYEDPGPSHLLLEEKSNKCAGPPCGVAIATSIY